MPGGVRRNFVLIVKNWIPASAGMTEGWGRRLSFLRQELFVTTVITLLILTCGCNAPKSQLKRFDGYVEEFDLAGSAEFAAEKISEREKPRGNDLLWSMQLGAVERLRGNYEFSTECFDKSEAMLKHFDERLEVGDAVSSTVINDNAAPYKGQEYDGVMVNVYKGLNFMMASKMELARVEFNRALDRQRRAKEKFSEEIQKLQSELNEREEKKTSGGAFAKKNAENPEVRDLLAARYPSLYNYEAYPDFVNPFATYIAGVFFNLMGDHEKAIDLLKESYGMVGENEYIAEDLNVTEGLASGASKLEDTVWVIFENGLGPVKEEFRIDVPLFIATDKVQYVGIALPKLAYRRKAYPYLTVSAGGQEYKTSVVADMDRVVQTEFNKDYKGILTRAIISATAKAAAQYAVSKDNSSGGAALATIFTAVYSYATTAADVRMWTMLPKEFQVARLEKPADGKLLIGRPGTKGFAVDIGSCNNAIVYVKIISSQAEVICEVIGF
jgi:hypothetical protein